MRVLMAALPAAGAGHVQLSSAGCGWFGTLIDSCWIGRSPDGSTRHTRCYKTQFGRFIRGTATLTVERDGQTVKQFEGDSLFAWDESAKRIVYCVWGSDSNHSRLEASLDGDELFPVPSRKNPDQIAFRSVWRSISDNGSEVRRQRPDARGWSTELTVVYRRAR